MLKLKSKDPEFNGKQNMKIINENTAHDTESITNCLLENSIINIDIEKATAYIIAPKPLKSNHI